jgi:hypothetical protein
MRMPRKPPRPPTCAKLQPASRRPNTRQRCSKTRTASSGTLRPP